MDRIALDDFTKYKFLSGVKYSPDGRNACFAVHGSNLDDNRYDSNLWVYRVQENKPFRLTSFNRESAFIWLEDGEHILFQGARDSKDRDKKENGMDLTVFYSINIDGGEAQEAFRIPLSVNTIKQVDANTFVFTSTFNPASKDLNLLGDREKEEELTRRKEDKEYEVIEEIPFWSNGGGFISRSRERIFLYYADENRYEALTDEMTNVEIFNLSPDKKRAVIVGESYEGMMGTENAVYICELPTGDIRRVTPPEKFSYAYVDFIEEDRLICCGSFMEHYGINENPKFYVMNIGGGSRECLTPDYDRNAWNSVGTDCRYGNPLTMKVDGGHLYFVSTENESSNLNRIDSKGQIERITMEKGSVDVFDVEGGRVVFAGMRGMGLQELYEMEGSFERQITHFNDWVKDEKSMENLERLTVETEPGMFIDGWVIKPVDFDESKSFPAILDIHGGPKTVYGEVFYHEMQYLANEGYFVFFCNPRGSDGKGNGFADIRGKYGTIDYDDIMKFTDTVLEKYKNIDRERVGVTGGSYGGFMTNWIIGHTDRFRAAVSQRSISNWISKFCTTDIGYYFVEDQNSGTPWNNQDKLWWHSPLRYADKVKTPTLFIHSEEDYRCWLAEGLQMFTALKYHGVESRLCMFRGENHELSRSGKPKHRIRRLREITDWFNKHLKQR